MSEYVSNCCSASPYLNIIELERCSDCKENCTFIDLREQRKYLVWIGGVYNAFNTLDEARTEKENYLDKGYTDVQIEIITDE